MRGAMTRMGTAFRCMRCDDLVIMLDGEPPFYCPRCGVGFTTYKHMRMTYLFDDLGRILGKESDE